MIRLLCVALIASVVGACSDFETASELSKPQILGLRAEPAAIAAGDRTRLTALVAGPDGPFVADVSWQLATDNGMSLASGANGTWLSAPQSASPQTVIVHADVAMTGETLSAVRSVDIGVSHANPVIAQLVVQGQPIVSGDTIHVSVGQSVDLHVVTEPASGPDAQVSWYATIGEVELYRRTPAELAVPNAGESGWLIVVVRDGEGGITWRSHPLVVD